MIEAAGLTKHYGDVAAVAELSFSVQAGEILGLVGPNGAGKTTTLRCLSGIIPPTGGQIRVGGHDLFQEPVEAKRLLAFIPDEPRLFDYLTVSEHLEFVSRLYGVSDSSAKASRLLERLELSGREKSLPGELSRGMKQKLAIACGLIHDPKALIFDEPLTGLDPGAIRKMKETISGHAREGAAIIVSSHLLFLVQELCGKVLILSHGRKVLHGTREEIARSVPELSADASLEEIFLRVTDASAASGAGSGSPPVP